MKARNKVKYDKIHINQTVLCNCNDTIDQTKILTVLFMISNYM